MNLTQNDSQENIYSVLDSENFVKSSTLPICLMLGEKDTGINMEYLATIKNSFKNKNSQFILIEGAPHAVFRTHGSKFLEIIDEFIKNVKKTNSDITQLPATKQLFF